MPTLSLLVPFQLIRSVLYFLGVFFVFFRGKFDRTGSTYRPPHHRSASQEERFSGFSFPSLLSKFSLQKSGKLYFESKTLDFFLNKHFSTTQAVLRILCKRGLLARLPRHSFCNIQLYPVTKELARYSVTRQHFTDSLQVL